MFISVSTHPLLLIICISPLVLEPYRNAISCIAPKFLHQTIIQFFSPFTFKEFYYCLSSCEEFCTITPPRIQRISLGYKLWVPCIPCILSSFDLFTSCVFIKRRFDRCSHFE